MKKKQFRKALLLTAILYGSFSIWHSGNMFTAEAAEQADSAEAVVMQLMKTEGEVNISNSSGKDISLISNMKLYNGYHANTQESSYAWINLDSEKLTKLDAVSEAEIRKKGKKLELLLESGNLFFDIKEKLTEEETLNVRTSTMVMGVRGTCGWVKVLDKEHSQVYVLEGTVQCHVTDPVTNQKKSITLNSGETAEFVSNPQEQQGDKCDITMRKFTEDDIDGFALIEAAQDPSLCERIKEASGMDLTGMEEIARQRIEESEARMSQTLDEIHSELENQENVISKDTVWGNRETNGEQTENVTDGSRESSPDYDSEADSRADAREESVSDSVINNDSAADQNVGIDHTENISSSETNTNEGSSSGDKPNGTNSSGTETTPSTGNGGHSGHDPNTGSSNGTEEIPNTGNDNSTEETPDTGSGSGSGNTPDTGSDNGSGNTPGTGDGSSSETNPDPGNTNAVIGNSSNWKEEAVFDPAEFHLDSYDGGTIVFFYDEVNNADIMGHLEHELVKDITFNSRLKEYTGEDGSVHSVYQNTLYVVTDMTIPTGKEVSLLGDGNLQVENGSSLTIDGKLIVEGNLINNGTITVNGGTNCVEVKGDLINNGTINGTLRVSGEQSGSGVINETTNNEP